MGEHERITVSISPMSWEALDFLTAERSGATKTDVINRALQFYAAIRKTINEGGAVYIREPDAAELERVRIF